MGVSRKQSTPNFPKNKHFLPPDTHIFSYSHWHATMEKRRGLPCPSWKSKKSVLILERKAPDSVHHWVKFSIQNAVLRVSEEKKLQNVSLRDSFFLCFWQNVYRSTRSSSTTQHIFRTFSKVSGGAL